MIPRTALWKAGYSWRYLLASRLVIKTGSSNQAIDITFNTRCIITSMKTIKVPAGTFRCFGLRQATDVSSSTDVHGHPQTRHYESHTVAWYAPGVGLVESNCCGILSQLAHYHIAK
ncbi:MAG: hypothetical protein ACP5O1_11175 [Phycisphaerae bacterium]